MTWTYTPESGKNEASSHQDYHRKWGCKTIFGTQLWCFRKPISDPSPTAAPNFGSFTEHRDHLARRGHDAWGWVILIIDVFWRFLMFYSFSPLLDVVILGVHDHLLYAKYESCKKPWYSLLAGETHLSNHNLVARLQHGLGRPVSFADKCRP